MAVPSARIREVLPLSEEEYEDLWKRLRYFTHKNYDWVPLKMGRGINLDDIIQDAIVDALTGKRGWHSNVDPFIFLCNIIRSKINHILEKEGRVISIEDYVAPGCTTSPRITRQEQQAAYKELCKKILALVRGNELLIKIVKLWIKEPNLKPKEIADMLSISIEEMRCAQRSLTRRVKGLREEYLNG